MIRYGCLSDTPCCGWPLEPQTRAPIMIWIKHWGYHMKESLNKQVYLTRCRKGHTRQNLLCINPARPPKRVSIFLLDQTWKGTPSNQDKMNYYNLLCIKCPLPDKLSAANVLPDTPQKVAMQTLW